DVLPGTNVINDYTVAEYTLALAEYLLETKQSERGVILGGDTRIKSILPYRDEISYVELEAKILRMKGIKVYRFKSPRSIAQVAWATLKFDAASMEYNSASHNVWFDNGVKASNEFSAQLFANEREGILIKMLGIDAEKIGKLQLDGFDLEEDRRNNPDMHIVLGSFEDHQQDPAIIDIDSEYIKVNQSYVINNELIRGYSSKVNSFFTPIQGAGIYTIPQVFNDGKDFRFNAFVYDAQAYQDTECRFSTVEKPDPNFMNQKTGARTMDKAIQEAEKIAQEKGIVFDFVFGTDPDADRSSYVVRNRNGEWTILKANDVWSLFTWYIMKQKNDLPEDTYVIKTWVTTDLIKVIAEDLKRGLKVFEPAVGFNKIAEVALKAIVLPILAQRYNVSIDMLNMINPLTLDGLVETLDVISRIEMMAEINAILRKHLLFGAEESNGFSPGGHTLEKDGAVAGEI
ncbi:MAG: hypothetical protein NT079_02625, partial [Candidatus Omnitrophica bacterium]|nr:hypothetical protein [Candidatus Omnitrophota bacterium]